MYRRYQTRNAREEKAVYVVMIRVRPSTVGGINSEILTVKLRKRDADDLCRQVPGAWVEKVVATKP